MLEVDYVAAQYIGMLVLHSADLRCAYKVVVVHGWRQHPGIGLEKPGNVPIAPSLRNVAGVLDPSAACAVL